MSKVKKLVRKVGVRNVKAVKTGKKSVKTTRKPGVPSRRERVAADPAVRFEIRELDPIRKCGPRTTVQHLLRVIERTDGHSTSHLVFFDRHGWYCEHGRACHAVKHAQKQKGRLVRATSR